MKRSLAVALMLAAAAATPAIAADAREFCPDRPGLGTPACTMNAGRIAVEIGIVDWTLERDAESRTDTIVGGDTLVRLGIDDATEVQVGWTAFGHVRTRDRATGMVDRASGTGDVTLAVRRNLRNPDGSGVSFAVMPYATLPTGGSTIGAGDWGAGLIVPISFDLGRGLSLGLSPEIDAAVDEDRDGRHLAYGSVIGLGLDFSAAVSATLEFAATRDRDPDGRATQALAGLSMAWTPEEDTQLDVGVNAGLNHATADVQVYAGIARRF
jgi:hypothetical protein